MPKNSQETLKNSDTQIQFLAELIDRLLAASQIDIPDLTKHLNQVLDIDGVWSWNTKNFEPSALKIIETLLKAGADITSIIDRRSYLARTLICKFHDILLTRTVNPVNPTELLELLVKHRGIYDWTTRDVKADVHPAVENLIKAGADINPLVSDYGTVVAEIARQFTTVLLTRTVNSMDPTELLNLLANSHALYDWRTDDLKADLIPTIENLIKAGADVTALVSSDSRAVAAMAARFADILLTHTVNQANTTKLLSLLMRHYGINDWSTKDLTTEAITGIESVLKAGADVGALINDRTTGIAVIVLRFTDVLLTRTVNAVDPTQLLSCLAKGYGIYDWGTQDLKADVIPTVKTLIEAGADINPLVDLYNPTIAAIIYKRFTDVLLTRTTNQMDTTQLLNILVEHGTIHNWQTHELKTDVIPAIENLIKAGADISALMQNHSYAIAAIVSRFSDVLLTRPVNQVDPTQLLSCLMKNYWTYDSETQDLKQDVIPAVENLIKAGANINTLTHHYGNGDIISAIISRFVDVFLTRTTNPMDPTQLLNILAEHGSIYDYLAQDLKTKVIPTVEAMLKAGADTRGIASYIYEPIVYRFIDLLLSRSNTPEEILGKLSTSGVLHSELSTPESKSAIKKLIKALTPQSRIDSDLHSGVGRLILQIDISLEELHNTGLLQHNHTLAGIASSLPLHRESNADLVEYALTQLSRKYPNGIDDHDQELSQEGLGKFAKNPEKFAETKYKYLEAKSRTEACSEIESNTCTPGDGSADITIPRKIHHIWLTSPSKPKELRDEDIATVLKTRNITADADYEWEHIVWTNDRHLIPQSVAILESNGVQVREVRELNEELRIPHEFYKAFVEKKWGMASDILRVEIVNCEGGIYMDLNYCLARILEQEIKTYDYFTQSYGGHYIDNFFFGSKAHHPILERWLKIIHRNFNNPPEYLHEIIASGKVQQMTDMMTANPSAFSFYLEANKDGNVDCVYPGSSWQGEQYLRAKLNNETYFEPRWEPPATKFPDDGICLEHPLIRQLWKQFEDHGPNNEMCLAPEFIPGHDGHNGQTWLQT